MMGVSFALPSMWDTLIFPFYFKAKIKLIIKLVINQQVASSCEWLGEDHLEKGGTKLAPHSLSHSRPTHSPHTQGPQATWHPPLGTKAAKVGCHVLLSVAATPSKPSKPSTCMRAAAAAGQHAQHACAGCCCWPCALASAARQQAMA